MITATACRPESYVDHVESMGYARPERLLPRPKHVAGQRVKGVVTSLLDDLLGMSDTHVPEETDRIEVTDGFLRQFTTWREASTDSVGEWQQEELNLLAERNSWPVWEMERYLTLANRPNPMPITYCVAWVCMALPYVLAATCWIALT